VAKSRPTPEQRKVLEMLEISPYPVIAYYKGGYWASPNQAVSTTGRPLEWHVSAHTVKAMEAKGWLKNSYVNTYLKFDREMVPSGLVGPVRLLGSSPQPRSP